MWCWALPDALELLALVMPSKTLLVTGLFDRCAPSSQGPCIVYVFPEPVFHEGRMKVGDRVCENVPVHDTGYTHCVH